MRFAAEKTVAFMIMILIFLIFKTLSIVLVL